MLPHLKKSPILATIAAAFSLHLFLSAPVNATNFHSGFFANFASLSGSQLEMFSQNNILFYDPSATDCSGGGANLLAGNSFEEKIWNYFVNANISGVSDNAAVIAGIMGNLYEESNYDPFLYDSYWGIYQTEKSSIKGLVDSAIPSAPWHRGQTGNPSEHPEDITTQAIQIELNQLTQQNPRFKLFLNDLGKVSNNTGETGAANFAELFLVHIERAVADNRCVSGSDYGNGVKLSDPGVQQAANDLYRNNSKCQNVKYQATARRTEAAKRIFKQYSTTSGSSSISSGSCGDGVKFCAPGEECTSDGFTQYSQGDERWKTKPFGSNNMSTSGCGPSAFATAATNLLHKKVTPLEVWEYSTSQGVTSPPTAQQVQNYATKYGLESKDLTSEIQSSNPNTETIINDYLKNGWLIQIVLKAGDDNCFTSGGHYVIIREVTSNGRWKIATNTKKTTANCSAFFGDSSYQNEVEWYPAYIINRIKGNTTVALRSGPSSCIDQCGSSSGAISGGFTNEQAREFAQKYKDAPTNDWSVPVNSYGKWNCVSLSAFFVQKFTSIGRVSRSWGHGRDVSYNLAQEYNLPHGAAPRPYSIFSVTQGRLDCPDGLKCGHTGVVVAVNGDDIVTVEAAAGNNGYTEVVHRPLSYFRNEKHGQEYAFTYLDNVLDTSKLNEFMGQ